MNETYERNGYTGYIEPEMEPSNPFLDWDIEGAELIFDIGNYGRIITADVEPGDVDGAISYVEDWEQNTGWAFDVYAYVHSGIRVKLGSFQGLLPQGHAEFDSGKAGWILINSDENATTEEEARERAKSLIGILDQMFSGDVWQFMVVDECDEPVDGCGGIFGYDEAEKMMREAVDEAAGEIA